MLSFEMPVSKMVVHICDLSLACGVLVRQGHLANSALEGGSEWENWFPASEPPWYQGCA